MRKQHLAPSSVQHSLGANEIDILACARVLFSSEAVDHPVEHILDRQRATYWSSERPNCTEEIVLEFDQPQKITRLGFVAEEHDEERTQEVRGEYSLDGGIHYRNLFLQEYNFSPRGAIRQREDLQFDLNGVTHLRFLITPNKRGQGRASLTSLRLFR
jgi:hypothetical protein